MRQWSQRAKSERARVELGGAAAHPNAAAGARAVRWRIPQWLVALGLFALALLPRGVRLATFVTVDEAYHWFDRVDHFRLAVRDGHYAATNLVGHPGVTTMWLGAIGLEAQLRLARLGLIDGGDGVLLRALMRLPVAVATSLCLALAYPLLIRLLGRRAALLAALLWATEPFLVAHSQLLHVDALLTSFMTLALLAALVAFRFDEPAAEAAAGPRWGFLAMSGLCGGLALVTKSPALLLLPMVGLIGLVAALGGWWRERHTARDTRQRLPLLVSYLVSLIAPMALWALIVVATWLALWPAAWVDPAGAVSTVLHQAEADGGSPHGWGNYFLGRAVADPGPLFYPVALAFRLAPWTLLGALAGLALLWRRATRGRAALALLAIFALLFVIMMSVPPKKFDRYALPVFPALDIIAAAGLIACADWLMSILRTKNQEPTTGSSGQAAVLGSRFSVLAWGFVTLALAANLAWFHPYELAYYSPLLGGGAAAERAIPIGWGEGYEQVGRFIMAQPDRLEKPVATWFGPVLRPFVDTQLGPLTWALIPGRVGYVVLYVDQIQRADVPQATALFLGKVDPIYTVRIHGIDYAYVYQAPPAIGHPAQATFGPQIALAGYNVESSAPAATAALTITLNWRTSAASPDDYLLFAHLLDARGQVIARADVPPGGSGPLANTRAWPGGRYVTGSFALPLAAAPAPGHYWLSIGLYHPDTGQRLPLAGGASPGAPDDGPDALRLPVDLPARPAAPTPAPTAIPADEPPPP
jgi:hypothetical protein